MKPDDIALKILQLQFDSSYETILQNRDKYLEEGSIYFSDYDPKWYMCGKYWNQKEDYFKLMRAAILRYGFKWVCFDHFHKLVTSLNYTTQEQSNLAREFKKLAEETETTILLIAQPRKRSRGEKGILLAEHISGSFQLSAEADCLITMTRKRVKLDEDGVAEQSFEPECFVRVDMTRWSPGGGVMLNFEGETQKFTQLERNDMISENSPEEEPEDDTQGDPFA